MEPETFQQQALDFRMPDEDFDPDMEPQDGAEYLMKVVYERKKCPAVVVKPLEQTKVQKISIPDSSISSDISDISPVSLRPTKEWKSAQLEDFQEMRLKINKLRLHLDENGFKSDNDIPLVDDQRAWEDFCRQNDPLVSIILRINQRALEKLLNYESIWLKDDIDGETVDLSNDDTWLGKWIYSTLVCLKMPLEPDVHSILRDIAKTCISLRNKLNDNKIMEAAPYNLFIFLIGKFYEQLDLLEFV